MVNRELSLCDIPSIAMADFISHEQSWKNARSRHRFWRPNPLPEPPGDQKFLEFPLLWSNEELDYYATYCESF
jgi:hypothetical protein